MVPRHHVLKLGRVFQYLDENKGGFMKEEIKIFNQYVKQFNLKEKELLMKFHHTFRVMDYCIEIASSLNLTEDEIKIAGIIGLLHDIGRFEQWKNYHTYHDIESVDHADFGVQILQENYFISKFIEDINYQNIILKAIKNHNRLKIEPMNEIERLFTNIIRDADKIDILIEQNNQIKSKKPILNMKLVQSILEKELCKDTDLHQTDEDQILRSIAFLFDMNFPFTISLLRKKKTIEQKLNLLEIYFPDNPILEQIKTTIFNYIEERMKNKC